jgi:hypothetical protein
MASPEKGTLNLSVVKKDTLAAADGALAAFHTYQQPHTRDVELRLFAALWGAVGGLVRAINAEPMLFFGPVGVPKVAPQVVRALTPERMEDLGLDPADLDDLRSLGDLTPEQMEYLTLDLASVDALRSVGDAGREVYCFLEQAVNKCSSPLDLLSSAFKELFGDLKIAAERLRAEVDAESKVARAIPKWDAEKRTLYLREQGVKTYGRQPAGRQTDLLEAFERAGWQRSIADPFRDHDTLKQTCKDLNKALPEVTLRFRLEGTGERVFWELAMPPASSSP